MGGCGSLQPWRKPRATSFLGGSTPPWEHELRVHSRALTAQRVAADRRRRGQVARGVSVLGHSWPCCPGMWWDKHTASTSGGAVRVGVTVTLAVWKTSAFPARSQASVPTQPLCPQAPGLASGTRLEAIQTRQQAEGHQRGHGALPHPERLGPQPAHHRQDLACGTLSPELRGEPSISGPFPVSRTTCFPSWEPEAVIGALQSCLSQLGGLHAA